MAAALPYISDRAGTLDIWVRDMASGEERAVTTSDGAEPTRPGSPDGSRIAYQTESHYHSGTGGGTMIVDVGPARAAVSSRTSPSRDGRAGPPMVRGRLGRSSLHQAFPGGDQPILVVDVESGEQALYEPRENASLTTRSDNGRSGRRTDRGWPS